MHGNGSKPKYNKRVQDIATYIPTGSGQRRDGGSTTRNMIEEVSNEENDIEYRMNEKATKRGTYYTT